MVSGCSENRRFDKMSADILEIEAKPRDPTGREASRRSVNPAASTTSEVAV